MVSKYIKMPAISSKDHRYQMLSWLFSQRASDLNAKWDEMCFCSSIESYVLTLDVSRNAEYILRVYNVKIERENGHNESTNTSDFETIRELSFVTRESNAESIFKY